MLADGLGLDLSDDDESAPKHPASNGVAKVAPASNGKAAVKADDLFEDSEDEAKQERPAARPPVRGGKSAARMRPLSSTERPQKKSEPAAPKVRKKSMHLNLAVIKDVLAMALLGKVGDYEEQKRLFRTNASIFQTWKFGQKVSLALLNRC